MAFAEVERFLDTPVKRYSSGMYVRLAFAVAAHLEPEILVVDEVLAVGDASVPEEVPGQDGGCGQRGADGAVRQPQHGSGPAVCQRGMVLNGGRLCDYGAIDGAVSAYLQEVKARALDTELGARTDRKGSQWLRFTKVTIHDSQGDELQQVVSGQDALLRFRYESARALRNASVLVSFNVGHQGYLLANLNSRDSGDEVLNITGGVTWSARGRGSTSGRAVMSAICFAP